MSDDILSEAKEAFELAQDAESENRLLAMDDLRFGRLGEQWPEEVERQRALEQRPCLTINRMPSFIRQVVNDARQNKPEIKVRPVDDVADPDTAEILNGLIRNIEQTSFADVAYDTAADFACSMGWGYIRVGIEYAHDDSFDQDIRIKSVPNPFAIYGDPSSTEPDGSDWKTAFVTEWMPKKLFQRRFKGAGDMDWSAYGYAEMDERWIRPDEVMLAEWWLREEIDRDIVLLSDGTVIPVERYQKAKDAFDAVGVLPLQERKSKTHRVRHRLMTGSEVLEDTVWPGRYIPIIPVYGEEINVGGRRHWRSLIRDAKDPQRMFNYWRSASTELVALAPKAPFIGPVGAFDTDADKWATANTTSHAYIEYDAVQGQPPPQRQAFAGVPAGALQEALNAADDMKSIVGIYDPALGARSNETSGKAIIARQRESDTSTFHFVDNVVRGVRQTGRVILDLIPEIYSTSRIIRTLGLDGEPRNVRIGPQQSPQQAPMQGQQQPATAGLERVYDLTIGKYDVVVTAGPSYTTKREEAAVQMTEFIRAFPAAAPVIGDLLAKNLDWPGADEIAQRLQALQQQADPQAQQRGEAQAQQAKAQAEAQAQMQKAQMEYNIKREQMLLDAQLEREKNQMQIELEREKGAAQLELARQQRLAELQLDRERQQAEIVLDAQRTKSEITATPVEPGGVPG